MDLMGAPSLEHGNCSRVLLLYDMHNLMLRGNPNVGLCAFAIRKVISPRRQRPGEANECVLVRRLQLKKRVRQLGQHPCGLEIEQRSIEPPPSYPSKRSLAATSKTRARARRRSAEKRLIPFSYLGTGDC
jgi:hypothetical protein